VTLLATEELPAEARLAAVLGGLGAGYVGGALPDIFEPALHSWHRAECHSATACVGAIAATTKSVATLGRDILERAAELRARRLALRPDDASRFWLGLQELGLYASYGAIIGLAAGYASHVILDGGTSRGIPLIGKGL
jgi:hypothetical protein